MSVTPEIIATAGLSRDGIILLSSADHTLLHANPAAVKMLAGLEATLKTGTSLKHFLANLAKNADFAPGETQDCVRQALADITKNGTSDLPGFVCDGHRVSWRRLAGPGGTIALCLREEGRADLLARALSEHKSFIEHLIEVLPIPVYLKNTDGVINRCNTAFADLIGKAVKSVIGQKSSAVTPKTLDDVMTSHERPLLTQVGHVRDEITFERDGAETIALFAASTLKAPSGAIGGTIGSLVDITSLKKAEAEVAGAASRLIDILQKAPVGVGISARDDGTFLFGNRCFNELLAVEDGEDTASDSILLSERYREKSLQEMDMLGELHDIEMRIRRPGMKEARWLKTSLEPIKFEGREAVLWWVSDITKQKMAARELHAKANNDELTGLANRARFMQKLNHCESVLRGTETPAAVFLLDLDGFKELNDHMGHAAGDWVLTETARRMVRVARRADEVARLGGDEFTLLFINKGGETEMAKVAQDILNALSEPFIWEGHDCHIGASLGLSVFDGGYCDMSEQLRRADKAMYAAKFAGKGCYRVYQSGLENDQDCEA
ncbi:MAG: diguanylate cyclase [Pseudomonadota bacterium]